MTTNRGPNRTLNDALRNAERIRQEIPILIQPEDTAYDMVTLADEVYRLRRGETLEKMCRKYDAYYYSDTGKWMEGKCGDRACKYCKGRPRTHPVDCECKK